MEFLLRMRHIYKHVKRTGSREKAVRALFVFLLVPLFFDDGRFAFRGSLFKEVKRLLYLLLTEVLLTGQRQRGISENVENAVAAKDSICADTFGDLGKIGNLDNRNARALNFFCNHGPATT
ncbi:MAG: hypothetical protein SOY64_01880 [Pyramidobacter sp.]|nr:hypothetical protein [Pyramidobacter sp.]